MSNIAPAASNNLLQVFGQQSINFLAPQQLNDLTSGFQAYYEDNSIGEAKRKWRGKQWLVFLGR